MVSAATRAEQPPAAAAAAAALASFSWGYHT
jgi:hypothetical protein